MKNILDGVKVEKNYNAFSLFEFDEVNLSLLFLLATCQPGLAIGVAHLNHIFASILLGVSVSYELII